MIYDYWVVTNTLTGSTICNCGDINDAIMMVSLDPQNRSYRRQRFLMDQVIDISSTTDKQLNGQQGLPQGAIPFLKENKYQLPESQLKPIIV